MFIHEELLSVIFRLVNFGVLVFLFIHVFRRYLLPMLHDQIQEHEQQKQAIKDRHVELAKQKKIVKRCAQEQKELCMLLQKKVVVWANVCTRSMEEKAQEKELRIERLHKRAQRQENCLRKEQGRIKIIPSAVRDAHAFLVQEFKSQEKQDEFIAQLMQAIKQEVL